MNLNDQELKLTWYGTREYVEYSRTVFSYELLIQLISNKSYLAQTNKKNGGYS